MQLTGTSAIVTGGASGLGRAAVRELASRGVRCTIFDLDEDGARQVAAEVGAGANSVIGDVSDPEDCRRAVGRANDELPLRIAVNCAGGGHAGRTVGRDGTPHDVSAFEATYRLNVLGTFNIMSQAAAAMAATPPLADGERGVIVNTASIAAFDGQVGQLAYASSKAAVVGMTLPAARDLALFGIRVVAIAPGMFATPMTSHLSQDARDSLGAAVTFPNRLGEPDDYGQLVAAIVENRYLNAEVIRLDGGIRMPPRW